MSNQSLDSLKSTAEEVLRECSITNMVWVGPELITQEGTKKIIGLWFEWEPNVWKVAGFTSRRNDGDDWSEWDRGMIDDQIALFIRSHQSEVETFVRVYPNLARPTNIMAPKCVCGALKTNNKNCHSRWCPLYCK